jgi:hypothetical protein
VKKLHKKLSNKPLVINRFSKLGLTVFVIIFASTAGYFIYKSFAAGNSHYVRAGATGNGSGSDWTNACTDFTGSCAVSSLVRGDTYYVAAGNYGARTFNTAVSGTLTITIKGATASNHGTDTGWSSTYSVGTSGRQAHFTYNLHFDNAKYFIFDGNTACGSATGPACSDASTYGFTVDQPSNCAQDQAYVYLQTGTITNNTWAHVALTACGGDVGRGGFSDDFAQGVLANNTYSHIYCSGMEVCIDIRRANNITATNITMEYIYAVNAFSSPSHHGESINLVDHVDGVTLRYSVFPDCAGTACVASNDAVATQPCVNNANVYGNVFHNNGAGNGAVASTSACSFANTKVYNNTFYSSNGSNWFAGCASSNCGSATGNVAQNNLLYNQYAGIGGGVGSHDYNAFYSTSSTPSEAHGQVASGNPFVNLAGLNFHLTSDTSAWSSLGMPSGNNLDPDGVTRTSSRGAYQFFTGTPPPPPPSDTTAPTVSLTAPAAGATVTGSSVTVSANASDNVGVSGVQFKLDGANLGSEDTSSPYSITWNTTSASNGSHTLTAVARDAAGNSTTASNVSVTVSNAPSTPKASYALGEGSGTTSADSSGNNNTLNTLSNTTWGSGKYGSGLVFNGTTSYASAADSNSLDISGSGSVETWVKLNAVNVWQGVVAKGNVNDNNLQNYALEIDGTNHLECTIGNGSSSQIAISTATLSAGSFTHIACTWDGSNIKIYINGTLDKTTAQTVTAGANTSVLNLGQFGGASDFLSGTLDDVRIYDRAISVSEVTTDMNMAIDGASGAKPGDVNNDGTVNIFDLSILLSHYGGVYTPADFNNDGVVNIFDLSILLSNYGT